MTNSHVTFDSRTTFVHVRHTWLIPGPFFFVLSCAPTSLVLVCADAGFCICLHLPVFFIGPAGSRHIHSRELATSRGICKQALLSGFIYELFEDTEQGGGGARVR